MARVTMLLDNSFQRDHRVLKEARSLAGAGHRVRIVARAPEVGEERLPAREERDGFRVDRVPFPAWTRWRGPLRAWAERRWFERTAPLGAAAAAEPADVVHAHDLTTLGPAARAARALGAALVYDDHELYVETVHTTYPLDRGRLRTALFRRAANGIARRGARLERRLLPTLDGHVTVSESIAEEIARRYGVRPPRVVANCPPLRRVETPDDRLRRALGVGPSQRVVLYQGTMPASGAGQEDLVDAALHLPADVTIAFLGWGFGRAGLEARARDRGVADRARFLDPVPPDELPLWIAGADVAAVPNRAGNLSNLLALPNKLFEAMMVGVPVAAADTPEVRRVLEAYPAGALHAMESPEALARAVLDVVDAPLEARAAMRAAALRATEERYCWERQAETLLGLYEEILARR